MAKNSFLFLVAFLAVTLPNLVAAHPVPGAPVHLHDGFDLRTLVWFAVVAAVIAVFPLLAWAKENGRMATVSRRRK